MTPPCPTRRTLLAGLAAVATLGAGTVFAQSAAPFVLKVSTFVPAQDALVKLVETWTNEIERRSNGRIRFVWFPSSQMGPPDRQFDLARTGVADVALFIHGFTPGRFPMTELAYLPGTFDGLGSEGGAAVLRNLAAEYLASEHVDTKLLAIAPTPESFVFSAKGFPRYEALLGQRVRHPSATMAETLRALGAVPVGVPSPEMADALAKGLVDGLGINWQAAADWRIEEVGTQVLELPLGAVTFGLAMNRARYDALLPDLRALIGETAAPLGAALGRELDAAERQARARLRPMFAAVTPPADDVERFQALLASGREARIARVEAMGHPARAFRERLVAEVRAAATR